MKKKKIQYLIKRHEFKYKIQKRDQATNADKKEAFFFPRNLTKQS